LSRFGFATHSILSLKSLHFQSVVCSEMVEPMSQCYLPYKKYSVSLSLSFFLQAKQSAWRNIYPIQSPQSTNLAWLQWIRTYHTTAYCFRNFASIVPSHNTVLYTEYFLPAE
jgi:hypothetical protein